MNARDITLGMRVRVRATLAREADVDPERADDGGWSWVRHPIDGEPIVGIVAAIRTKNDGRLENVGEWDGPSYEYVARSYMRAASVYSSLHHNPVWALLDDIEDATEEATHG